MGGPTTRGGPVESAEAPAHLQWVALANLGDAHVTAGHLRMAAHALDGALAAMPGDAPDGDRFRVVSSRIEITLTALDWGRRVDPAELMRVRAAIETATSLARRAGDRALEGSALELGGKLHARAGNASEARADLRAALDILTDVTQLDAAFEVAFDLHELEAARPDGAQLYLRRCASLYPHVTARSPAVVEFEATGWRALR